MTLRNLGCVRFLQLTSCLEIMLSLLVLIIFIFIIIIMLSLLVLFILHIFFKVNLHGHLVIQVIILNILFIFYGMNSGWYHFVDSLGTELEVI